ncbi:MAG: protoporphyrinogen oxidase [Planctomycetales bacterium]|nr:protoporphyrinogen oxidase [Planctomycetales bacterium]
MTSPETTAIPSRSSLRVAVIGGGITGLAAAHRLREVAATLDRPLEVTLFEAGSRVGGVFETREVAGYRVECGADSFITNKPWAIDLCRRIGLESRLVPTDATYRRALVLRAGRPVEVPEGFQLLAPTKLTALLRSPIFSPWGKLRMALEAVLPRGAERDDESLADFVRRRFGREALERLVQPLVGGIYTSDPERLSLRATLPRFLEFERDVGSVIRGLRRQATRAAGRDESASGARYGLFATLAGGMSELQNALASRVRQHDTIQLFASVSGIQHSNDGYTLTMDPELSTPFDAVIVAVPAFRAADLVQSFAVDLAENLRRIEYASTAIVVSGHKLADVRNPLDAFGLVIPAIERRQVLAVSFTSRKFPDRAPPGCVQLRTFVGGAMQPNLFGLPDDELLAIVRRELEQLLGLTWRPDFTVVARHARSMPQYHVGHLRLVEEIEAATARHSRLVLAGNAFHGVGLPDCIHSGEQAAERIMESLRGKTNGEATIR